MVGLAAGMGRLRHAETVHLPEEGVNDPAGGFDARYLPHLVEAEDRHFWFRARNAVIGAMVRPLLPALPVGYRVLEVGCGTGNTLRVLEAICRPGSVVGMDAQLQGLTLARGRVSCPLVQGDASLPPFAPGIRFDLVGMFDVLEHIADDVGALAHIASQVSADGRLLVTVPAGPELWSRFDEAAHHCRRYTATSLRAALTSAGLDVDYLSPFMASLYPLAWAKRRLIRIRLGDERDPVLDDLRIVPVLNGCLAWLLGCEARLVAARGRLPFGTSILAVARSRSHVRERSG
jgi:SAM-dependent methyltransferase